MHGSFPKRLIEVDLPIARISAHARREKSIRHGHISTLHIWWARRPLAACRAVICAALWPDPADPLCPPRFREVAVAELTAFAKRVNPARITEEQRQLQATLSDEARARWEGLASGKKILDPADKTDYLELRTALLDFVADFANWDNSTVPAYLETSRAVTQAAHETLGGTAGTRPLVVDPFAGGGSIPLEALRVGADSFGSDLNPVPVLLNKVVLEYIPKYSTRLSEEVKKWGAWIGDEAKKELSDYYPNDSDGSLPVAYIWARTITCEGPACGMEVPLIRSLWIARKPRKSVAFRLSTAEGRIKVEIDHSAVKSKVGPGTTARGTVTCPACGFTTPPNRVKQQFSSRRGGVADSRLIAVVTASTTASGVSYREPNSKDLEVLKAVHLRIEQINRGNWGELSPIPDEPYPDSTASGALSSSVLYGAKTWGDIFSPRQALALTTFASLVARIPSMSTGDPELAVATATCLAFCVSKLADYLSSLCVWRTARSCAAHTFGRQALPMAWDYGEMNPFAGSAGDWGEAVRYMSRFITENSIPFVATGTAAQSSATSMLLPSDSAEVIFTDPPYYDAIAYGDLSDFFYVWLRRCVGKQYPNLLDHNLVNKRDELVQLSKRYPGAYSHKTKEYFETQMTAAMAQCRAVLRPQGIGIFVFAHKSTSGWEAMLQSLISAGWTVTGSWPIDTERGGRLNANDTAALASSVHIVCRPRESSDGNVIETVGEWRDVLAELPRRIHEWMPQLAAEGVVGADAIFACLGPALEIFSQYTRVEKANGDIATLREYLEIVWAAVSTEALTLIFKDADASGLEPDARLTAMWLWTLGGASQTEGKEKPDVDRILEAESDDTHGDEDDRSSSPNKGKLTGGFTLEFDAARKIAQGLGVHLEQCHALVEVSKDQVRLLPVSERAQHLFGKQTAAVQAPARKTKKAKQKTLFQELDEADASEAGWNDLQGPTAGSTVLDRVHQAMILFAANRGELLRRFLVEDGVGKDARFWKLADNLNKLYPPGTDERRWVEGVLARKKGLGL